MPILDGKVGNTVLVFAGLVTLYLLRAKWLVFVATWLNVGESPQVADYVMVLGGDWKPRSSVVADIIQSGLASKVLIPVGDFPAELIGGPIQPEHEVIRRALLQRGVPEANIILLGQRNRTTYDEGKTLAAYLPPDCAARVLVVTSDYHTRRTAWVFRQLSRSPQTQLSFVAAPTEEFATDHWWQSQAGRHVIVRENVKLVYYFFRYSHVPYVLLGLASFIPPILRRRQQTRFHHFEELPRPAGKPAQRAAA